MRTIKKIKDYFTLSEMDKFAIEYWICMRLFVRKEVMRK